MKRHRVNQKEVILMYENYQPSKDNLVFHQQDGRWLRTNVVREYFKKSMQAGRAAGAIPVRIKALSCRAPSRGGRKYKIRVRATWARERQSHNRHVFACYEKD
jgi:hypothetical protein